MKNRQRHILIFRFSAIGDVAMSAPLVKAYAISNPDTRFTFVSQAFLEPLFEGVPNLDFFPIDFKKRDKGFLGLLQLFTRLNKLKPTHIADIHNVLRTMILRTLFFLSFKRVSFIKKGLKEKVKLTRRRNKIFLQLPTMLSRYESVFINLGLESLKFSDEKRLKIENKHLVGGSYKIGVAPFAKHTGKTWPLENMEQVVSALSECLNIQIFLFGGGKREIAILNSWELKYSGVESVAGKLDLKQELALIGKLNVMLCMDSANMHFASFTNTPVISIWGATHPYAGFFGWNQDYNNTVQYDLECRPCSVFGNKPCFRGDYACLNNITPEMVISKVQTFLDQNK